MATNLDEQLMTRSSDEAAERAGRLTESRRGQSGEKETLIQQREREERENSQPRSLREEVMAAKKARQAKEEKGGVLGEAVSPIRKATSRLLRQAWLHVIDSWGLTFIWVNIHAFLSNVLGEKIFCKLGHEWADLAPAEAASNPAMEEAKKRAATVEKMGVGCIDAVLIVIILFIVGIIALILNVVDSPMSNLEILAGFAWEWVTGSGVVEK